jgi:hypothetical protein
MPLNFPNKSALFGHALHVGSDTQGRRVDNAIESSPIRARFLEVESILLKPGFRKIAISPMLLSSLI